MIPKTLPETSRNRKMVIDELIVCLERYAGHTLRLHDPELRSHSAHGRAQPLDDPLAGAA